MARPLKEGMDYFPHDTDASNDEKIEALRVLHGNDGYAFYFILLERIYRTSDAELDISKPAVRAALIAKVGVSADKFEEMLQTAFDVELFDREAYEQRQVLTSNGIKRRAAEVQAMRIRWRKRKDNHMENPEENPVENPEENVGENSEENPVENPEENVGENSEETGERKEKKRKEKEKNNPTPYPSPNPSVAEQPQDSLNEASSVPVDRRYEELLERYTPEQRQIIADYWDVIRFTRKNAYVADSIKLREMEYWLRFPPDIVIEALETHKIRYPTKREDYTRGIMRRIARERELSAQRAQEQQQSQSQSARLIELDPAVVAAWRERFKRAREKSKQAGAGVQPGNIPPGYSEQS